MKSIKPGRGPSMMGAVVGVAVVIFGILWTVGAATITQPDPLFPGAQPSVMEAMSVIFPLFGVLFIIVAAAGVIYNFKNATGRKRYSEYDIVDSSEEPDPLNERFGESPASDSFSYCPHCGKKLDSSFRFCPHCGADMTRSQ